MNNEVISITLYWSAPVIVTITTIGVYQYLNSVMDINNIMIGLYVFGLLNEPLCDFPYAIISIIDTMISMRRIEVKFFLNSEIFKRTRN